MRKYNHNDYNKDSQNTMHSNFYSDKSLLLTKSCEFSGDFFPYILKRNAKFLLEVSTNSRVAASAFDVSLKTKMIPLPLIDISKEYLVIIKHSYWNIFVQTGKNFISKNNEYEIEPTLSYMSYIYLVILTSIESTLEIGNNSSSYHKLVKKVWCCIRIAIFKQPSSMTYQRSQLPLVSNFRAL